MHPVPPIPVVSLAGREPQRQVDNEGENDRADDWRDLFFTTGQTVFFFRPSARKTKKQKFVTRNPGDTMGVSGYGYFFCLGAVCARSAHRRVFTEPWETPPTDGTMKIKRGVVYNPTIHHGYLLDKNRHPGRRQPWPLPPPIVPPRLFRSRARVDRAMGDAPYRWRHENRAGGCV